MNMAKGTTGKERTGGMYTKLQAAMIATEAAATWSSSLRHMDVIHVSSRAQPWHLSGCGTQFDLQGYVKATTIIHMWVWLFRANFETT